MKIKTLYEHQVLHLYVEHDKVLLDVDTENILNKKTDKLFVVLSNPCQGIMASTDTFWSSSVFAAPNMLLTSTLCINVDAQDFQLNL